MAVDLLTDVKKTDPKKKGGFNVFKSSKNSGVEVNEDSAGNDNYDITNNGRRSKDANMDDSDVDMSMYGPIKSDIEKMESNRQALKKLQSRFHTSATPENDKKIADELEKLIANNNALTRKLKSSIAKENSKAEASGNYNQKNMLKTVNNQFRTACTNFETTVNEMMKTIKQKNIRQIKILDIDHQLNDDEIETIVENPAQARDLIQKQFQMSDVSDQMLDTIANIEEKYEGMKKIEQEIQELHQLFGDLSVIVNEQQEQFDTIEQHVEQTKSNVVSGTKHLESAERKQKCTRKLTCYALLGLLCIVVVIIILLFSVAN